LDYDLQRYGTGHARSRKALEQALKQLDILRLAAERNGYEILVFGDYALEDVSGSVIYPNRELRRHEFLSVRDVDGMEYPDLYSSRAFAMVDHAVAHVYVADEADIAGVAGVLRDLPGVEQVLDADGQDDFGIGHANSGELVLLAKPGSWFAYPWWRDGSAAPDYAGHVDIHNKPGYDPAELFWGWPPGSVSRRPERVGGTHGRVGAGHEVAWASSVLDGDYRSLVDLSLAVREYIEG
jgi:hypothetical protein